MLSQRGGEGCFRNCSSNQEVVSESRSYTSFQPEISQGFTSITGEGHHFHFGWGTALGRRTGSIWPKAMSNPHGEVPRPLLKALSIRLVHVAGSPDCSVPKHPYPGYHQWPQAAGLSLPWIKNHKPQGGRSLVKGFVFSRIWLNISNNF